MVRLTTVADRSSTPSGNSRGHAEKAWLCATWSANGLVKNQIFGFNSACVYNLNLRAEYEPLSLDKFAQSSRSIVWLVRSTNSVTMLLTASLPSVRRKMLAHGDSGWGQVPSA